MNIPRSSVAQMELGNRNVSVTEMISLSEILGFSIDRFLAADYSPETKIFVTAEPTASYQKTRVSIPEINPEKFRNVLLYILEHSAGKPNVGETVLNKLLYFCDFNFYEIYEEHLTGAQYRKLPFGPVPQKLDSIITQMIESGMLQRIKTEFKGFPQTRFLPLVKADLTRMSAAEKEVIDRVLERFSDWSASCISEYSHNDMPWKATDDGEIIDYDLALYRELPYSSRTYDEETER